MGGFGESEEDGPKDGFGGSAGWKCHLSEGKDIERDATEKDDDTRAERKSLQPCLDFQEETTKGGAVVHFSA